MEEMKENLKRKSIAHIWQYESNTEVKLQEQITAATKLKDRIYKIKKDLIDNLQKQADDLYRSKINLCITIDKQRSKLRREIEILRAEIGLPQMESLNKKKKAQ